MHPRGEGEGEFHIWKGWGCSLEFWIKPLDWPIVNRVDWLWNLSDSNSLVDMFLWTWKCTMLKRIPIILIVLTNKNVALIYSITICQKKTKDCAPSGSLQHKLQQALLFLSLMFAALHNQSPLITMIGLLKSHSQFAHQVWRKFKTHYQKVSESIGSRTRMHYFEDHPNLC